MRSAASVPYSSTCTEWSMTRSTGCSGLISRASPPRRARASRIAARSTTAGTPVKSWSSTRAVRNAISFSTFPFMFQVARARTSSGLTNLPSSFLSRFSRRTLRLNGSLPAFPSASLDRESSRKIVYCRPATSSVDRLPKEFGCAILIFSELGRVSALAVERGATAARIARQAGPNLAHFRAAVSPNRVVSARPYGELAHTNADLLHKGLILGISVLPAHNETAVIRERLSSLPAALVDLGLPQ